MKKECIVGKKFNRLTVVSYFIVDHRMTYLCRCDCGKELKILAASVKSGHTKSCGCLAIESKKRGTHKMTGDRFYVIWKAMKRRCNNKNEKNYNLRGIKYCISWEKFENFYEDMHDEYFKHVKKYGEKNTTIDRIDCNGNYHLENCRWATYIDQARNKRKIKNTSSRYIGVYYHKKAKKWCASIVVYGKSIWLGLFKKEEDAHRARKLAEKKYY